MSKKSIKSDLARVDRMRDADIDYSDIPPLDKSFFTKATAVWPPAKTQLTIRLDADVLAAGLRAFAHHSIAAEFEQNETAALKGSVTKLERANPRIWVHKVPKF